MRKKVLTKEKIIPQILPIIIKYGVLKASLFGSYARNEQNAKSDLDMIIQFNKNQSLFDLINLKLEISDLINKKIDIITYNSLNPHLKKTILKDEKIFYEKRS